MPYNNFKLDVLAHVMSVLNDSIINFCNADDLAEQPDEEPYVISPEEEDRIFLRARNQKG